jgi:hypothetical protein
MSCICGRQRHPNARRDAHLDALERKRQVEGVDERVGKTLDIAL